MIIGTTHLELEKCFDGESSGLSFDVVADRLLEDPTSQREQSGKLKIEAVYLSGYFRGSKVKRQMSPSPKRALLSFLRRPTFSGTRSRTESPWLE